MNNDTTTLIETDETVCEPFSNKTHFYLGPLVLIQGLPLIEGTGVGDGDYYWQDETHQIIAFEFFLPAVEKIVIIYRDKHLNPVERLDVRLLRQIPADTLFSVRTGKMIVKQKD